MHAASRDPRYRVDFAVGKRVCEINRATFGTISQGRLGGMGNLSVESDRRSLSIDKSSGGHESRIGNDLEIVNPSRH